LAYRYLAYSALFGIARGCNNVVWVQQYFRVCYHCIT